MFRKMKITTGVLMLIMALTATAETLFQIKDELGSPVLVVSSDGLAILNSGDTLMVISTEGIKAFIEEDPAKGLSRSFSVATTSSVKGANDKVMNVTADGLRIYDQTDESKLLGDTLMTISSKSIKAHIGGIGKALSRSFSVSTTSSTKAGEQTKVMEVGTESTRMKESSGDEYSDFTPENIFLGLNAGAGRTTGTGNAIVGNDAGLCLKGGHNNVIMGADAAKYFKGTFGNVFIGEETAMNITDGYRNVMIGYYSGADADSAQELTGNVFVGATAGRGVCGDFNVMVGEAAGENYQAGGSTGYGNIFIGKECGQHSTGHENIYIGYGTGRGETSNVHTGSGNIYLGKDAGWADVTESDVLRVRSLLWGNMGTSKMLIVDGEPADNTQNRKFFVRGSAGGTTDWYNDSDERLKKNIRTIDGALDKVMKLRGVNFEWKDPETHEKGIKMGFIAQESKDIIPEAVDYNAENDRYAMQYASITAVLVEAIKELKKEVNLSVAALETKETENKKVIDGQNEKIGMLINENKELKNKVQELESLRAEIDLIKRQIAGYTSK